MKIRNIAIVSALVAAVGLFGCSPKKDDKGKEDKQKQGESVKNKVPVELYIMSKCPHGARTAIPMIEAVEKLGGLVDLKIDYIVRPMGDGFKSLHGPPETKGNIYQLCANEIDADKFGPFVTCVSKNFRRIPGNWKACAKKVGLDTGALKKCAEGEKGKKLLRASAERAKKAGARGSPTILIAGKKYRGSRRVSDLMRTICERATEKTEACKNLPEPVKVEMLVLTDERCKKCRTSGYERKLKAIFPGIQIKKLDYGTEEGKKLYESTGVKLLPALLFDKKVEKTAAYSRFRRNFRKKGDYYQLRVRSKFDPTAEICDNKKDDTGNGKVDCDDPTCEGKLPCRDEKKGELAVFVMSQCPYGTRALDDMKQVLEAFGDEMKFKVHFIATKTPKGFRALHGQPEVDENIRELCAIEHYPKNYKFMDYIWCRNKNIRSKDWEKCTGDNGIKTAVIKKCFEGEEGKKLLEEDIKVAQALGVSASPTWLTNNKHKFKGVGATRIQRSFCKHNKDAKGCEKKLKQSAKRVPRGSCK